MLSVFCDAVEDWSLSQQSLGWKHSPLHHSAPTPLKSPMRVETGGRWGKYLSYHDLFFLTAITYIPFQNHELHIGEGWIQARALFEHIGVRYLCSRVPLGCSDGVLAPPGATTLLPEHLPNFVRKIRAWTDNHALLFRVPAEPPHEHAVIVSQERIVPVSTHRLCVSHLCVFC